MRILLADNETFLAENITQYLQNTLDASITWVTTVKESNRELDRLPYDLVISDLDLSDGSGGLWLQDLPHAHPDIPLIVISAHELPETLRQICKGQLAAYFEKPFDIVELMNTIQALFRDGVKRTARED